MQANAMQELSQASPSTTHSKSCYCLLTFHWEETASHAKLCQIMEGDFMKPSEKDLGSFL